MRLEIIDFIKVSFTTHLNWDTALIMCQNKVQNVFQTFNVLTHSIHFILVVTGDEWLYPTASFSTQPQMKPPEAVWVIIWDILRKWFN